MIAYSYTPEYRREYTERNRVKIRAQQRAHYARAKAKKLARMASQYANGGGTVAKAKHVRDPRLRMIVHAKFRAKKRGIPFDLTLESLGEMPLHCPALGIPLIVGGPRDNRPQIDRIVPSVGYVRGNVAIVSARANRIKNDGTLRELLLLTQWLQSLTGVK